MQITGDISDIRIGTCGYSYPGPPPKGWDEVFYPAEKRRGFDELSFYADYFDAVEINSSFYRPPPPAVVRGWAARTPGDFEFAVKAWQKFTHPTTLGEEKTPQAHWEAPTAADADIFKQSLAPLAEAGKLGTLLFQYPASFYFTPSNADRLIWTLEAFRDFSAVVELRHRSWSERRKETENILGDRRAIWAVIDEPKFQSSIRQPFEPNGGVFYLRLHGRNSAQWWEHGESWERYDYLYGAEKMQRLAKKIRDISEKRTARKILVFFNNHARGQAVADGLMLKRALGFEISHALPGGLTAAYPELNDPAR
ncbi:MAG TPA: DUF72 domain-containing protein [Verrucomicrobiae bacterium]|nr:DUF72 domain-containing protein [Verrucomicrobiae bacterium]